MGFARALQKARCTILWSSLRRQPYLVNCDPEDRELKGAHVGAGPPKRTRRGGLHCRSVLSCSPMCRRPWGLLYSLGALGSASSRPRACASGCLTLSLLFTWSLLTSEAHSSLPVLHHLVISSTLTHYTEGAWFPQVSVGDILPLPCSKSLRHLWLSQRGGGCVTGTYCRAAGAAQHPTVPPTPQDTE